MMVDLKAPGIWLRKRCVAALTFLRTANWHKIPTLLIMVAIVSALAILVRQGLPFVMQPIRFSPLLLGLSFLIECSSLLIAIPVWRRILKSYDIRQSMRDDLRIYCYSALGVTLPGGIWSIVGRSGLYQRLGANGLGVAAGSIVETFAIGVSALIVYATTILVRPDLSLLKQPEIGVGFAMLALVMIHPRVFNGLSGWVSAHTGRAVIRAEFGLSELAFWCCLEAIVIVIGGISVFVFLLSFWTVPPSVVVPTIAAWAAAIAVSNLFFWFPGTALARDAVMIAALIPALALEQAIVFVILWRVWTIAALLLLAGGIWLVFDSPIVARKSRS
jgi:hypothetical protein